MVRNNCELLVLGLSNISRHYTRGPCLQSRRIINFYKLSLTYNSLHCNSKQLERDLKNERYSNERYSKLIHITEDPLFSAFDCVGSAL